MGVGVKGGEYKRVMRSSKEGLWEDESIASIQLLLLVSIISRLSHHGVGKSIGLSSVPPCHRVCS